MEMKNIFLVCTALIICNSCTSFFIANKQYMSSCMNRQDNYCYVDTSADLRYAVEPLLTNMYEDSLFFEIVVTSTLSMLIDSFKVSCLYDNIYIKGHLVSKDTHNSLICSNWKFAWKKYTCKNFWKSHILIIEPAIIRDEKVEQLPLNVFRWQKKHK